jgi:hypothetical protein
VQFDPGLPVSNVLTMEHPLEWTVFAQVTSGVVAGRGVSLRPPGMARIAPRPDAGVANGVAVTCPRMG